MCGHSALSIPVWSWESIRRFSTRTVRYCGRYGLTARAKNGPLQQPFQQAGKTVLPLGDQRRSTLLKRIVFWIALVVLMILHHDWWFWNDGRLLFGFLPVGLGYHALISLTAAGLWGWAAF